METETHEDLVVKAIKELKKSPAKSVVLLGDLTATLGNQTSRMSNSSKTTETKRHGSKPLVSRIG